MLGLAREQRTGFSILTGQRAEPTQGEAQPAQVHKGGFGISRLNGSLLIAEVAPGMAPFLELLTFLIGKLREKNLQTC